jgi:hypothetical protein
MARDLSGNMGREGSHACFDARTCTHTLALAYAHAHAHSLTHLRSHARSLARTLARSHAQEATTCQSQRTRRGSCAHSLRAGLVYLNSSHVRQASAMPTIPSVHRCQGSQRAKRYRSAGEPFHSRARAPPCAEWVDPSRGCARAHTRTCRYEQADIGTAAEYLRCRRDPGSICLWCAWVAGPSCSHGTQVPGVRDGGWWA